MRKSDIRAKLFKKIAQSTDIADTEKTPASILPPPSFQFSASFPSIRANFNPQSIPIIDQLGSILNSAVHYLSAGKANLQVMKNNNFSTEVSSFPSQDTKSAILFSKLVFSKLLNNGIALEKPLIPSQIHDIVDNLIENSDLANLASINPTRPAAQKIQGNLKSDVVSILTNLKTVNV